MSPWERMSTINGHNIHIYIVLVNFVHGTYCIYIYYIGLSMYLFIFLFISIKGPDNATSQLLPIMSNKCCSGDGEGGKDKGGGRGKVVLDKVVCV